MGALTDAGKARQQLQAMAAAGFTIAWIAEQIGASEQGLGPIRNGRRQRTSPYTALCISRLYDRVQGTTPAEHGIPEGSSAWTRVLAVRNGWQAGTGTSR